MTNGLLGRKLAMSQIFDKDGNFIPVTLVEVGPCTVLEVCEDSSKVMLGFEDAKEHRVAKPQLGFFKKINVTPKRVIKEFKFDEDALNWLKEQVQKAQEEVAKEESKEDAKDETVSAEDETPTEVTFGVGSEIKANLFRPGDYVDVSGVSIGKGFQGGMKRWGWAGGPASHGSRHHREPGSIGQCAWPGALRHHP